MSKIQVKLYAHEEHEDSGWDVDQWVQAGVPEEVAKEFIRSRPLYEVTCYFEYDTETGNIRFAGATI